MSGSWAEALAWIGDSWDGPDGRLGAISNEGVLLATATVLSLAVFLPASREGGALFFGSDAGKRAFKAALMALLGTLVLTAFTTAWSFGALCLSIMVIVTLGFKALGSKTEFDAAYEEAERRVAARARPRPGDGTLPPPGERREQAKPDGSHSEDSKKASTRLATMGWTQGSLEPAASSVPMHAPASMPERIQAMFAGTHALPGYDRHMGFRFVAWSPEGATVEAEAGGQFANPTGVLHGGVLAGLADSAMGLTTLGLVGPGETTTNTDLQVRFLRATTAGPLRATARVLRKGRRTMTLECDVVDDQGRLVAKASSSFLVLRDGVA